MWSENKMKRVKIDHYITTIMNEIEDYLITNQIEIELDRKLFKENDYKQYFLIHRQRYIETMKRFLYNVINNFDNPCFDKLRILSIGCHYLHQEMIIKKLVGGKGLV